MCGLDSQPNTPPEPDFTVMRVRIRPDPDPTIVLHRKFSPKSLYKILELFLKVFTDFLKFFLQGFLQIIKVQVQYDPDTNKQISPLAKELIKIPDRQQCVHSRKSLKYDKSVHPTADVPYFGLFVTRLLCSMNFILS